MGAQCGQLAADSGGYIGSIKAHLREQMQDMLLVLGHLCAPAQLHDERAWSACSPGGPDDALSTAVG